MESDTKSNVTSSDVNSYLCYLLRRPETVRSSVGAGVAVRREGDPRPRQRLLLRLETRDVA
jgi:hypothetical protein